MEASTRGVVKADPDHETISKSPQVGRRHGSTMAQESAIEAREAGYATDLGSRRVATGRSGAGSRSGILSDVATVRRAHVRDVVKRPPLVSRWRDVTVPR